MLQMYYQQLLHSTLYSAYSVKNAVQDLSGWGVSGWKVEGNKKG